MAEWIPEVGDYVKTSCGNTAHMGKRAEIIRVMDGPSYTVFLLDLPGLFGCRSRKTELKLIHKRQDELEVGDLVRIVNPLNDMRYFGTRDVGRVGRVTLKSLRSVTESLYNDEKPKYEIEGSTSLWRRHHLEKIEEAQNYGGLVRSSQMNVYVNEPINNKKEGIMSVVEKIKNLALNKDVKLLRKYGIEDECGSLTAEGRAIAINKAYETHREAILTDLRALEAEDKKNKKE